MKQKTKWRPAALVLVGLAQICQAGTMKEAVSSLPGDVVAALFVGDLKQADADYRSVIDAIGLKDVVSEPQREPLARLKEKLPLLAGIVTGVRSMEFYDSADDESPDDENSIDDEDVEEEDVDEESDEDEKRRW